MKHPHVATIEVEIGAPVDKVWQALVDPQLIKQYLHGTNALSEWRKGSALTFSGEWNGKTYLDKGVILNIESNKELSYSWLSSMSGLEDEEENYSIITYRLQPTATGTKLKLTQANVPTEEGKINSEKNWGMVLNDLKRMLEK